MGLYAYIDEMLVAFRDRCTIKICIPKSPAKYGLKIICKKRHIYLCKHSNWQTLPEELKCLSKLTYEVLRLAAPIENYNRNVTSDKLLFFNRNG